MLSLNNIELGERAGYVGDFVGFVAAPNRNWVYVIIENPELLVEEKSDGPDRWRNCGHMEGHGEIVAIIVPSDNIRAFNSIAFRSRIFIYRSQSIHARLDFKPVLPQPACNNPPSRRRKI